MTRFSLGRWLLPTYVVLTFAFLMIPIIYTFVFSFNDSIKSNIIWRGFTFNNWINVCDQQVVCTAFGNSLIIALSATTIATVLGTMIAIALVRYRFKWRAATNLLLFLPLATPEVVMGAGLAAQFLDFGWAKGLTTVIIAHVMFTLSFVVVTVKARVATLDPALEEAGRDLYANPFQVFRKVTLPLLLPGILAAAMLAFALSFDDFIITQFNSGSIETFPKFVYTAAARGIPAEANVIGSSVFLIAIAIVLIVQIRGSRKAKKLAK
ncbi:ABC transporter permease [Candidatus Aquiluna sp. UB-MaderosW2red]|uniref:ABC transporter permease n=1 Tax=Candidatus Aquiluna sp. UB-MaderosW2red TaxID=1855377 RepID=UPI000875E20C|nr:ABC transporter permease [Candidatus Aquiluna sp. UB-MaderosW2red]SCX13682.1 spermidine/putrescine transport system permease protein [Candidatus Aquiluna sp. UB-MaderosW2red]